MQHNKYNTDTSDIIGKTFGELYVESYAGYINGKPYILLDDAKYIIENLDSLNDKKD